MIKTNLTINDIKQAIKNCYQKQVLVKLNLGRNKYVSFLARLDGVYPALFTVKAKDQKFKGKTTYSYSEYMCGKVKLKETVE